MSDFNVFFALYAILDVLILLNQELIFLCLNILIALETIPDFIYVYNLWLKRINLRMLKLWRVFWNLS